MELPACCCLPLQPEYAIIITNQIWRNVPRSAPDFARRLHIMKVLKVLLAVLTTLAVALTTGLLLWQDKASPRYIQIYDNEQ